MLFNSIDFAIFLPLVFIFYWLLRNNLKNQNLFVVAASFLFYGWWDWRFLSLIILSTTVDYLVAKSMNLRRVSLNRKLLLIVSLVANLGILGFFKYFNFFVENLVLGFSFFGNEIQPYSLSIVLPVGISFYTFQTLSYTIDVYRRRIEPTKDLIAFAAYVSFFPQLVAGPIERATNLLPQFCSKRTFEYSAAIDGMRQILWGLFKKIVIADNCALIVNQVFSQSDNLPGSQLAIGAIFFAFQIYGDFSGYSDIAIGTSRLLGFNIMRNFAFPYFSRDIAEFWRRWHISLSSWFRDYLYIPLGGSKKGTLINLRNIFIIFIISGFWHGANWTFIAWGAIHAFYFVPLFLTRSNRKHMNIVAESTLLPSLKEIFSMVLTFALTTIAWIFFRAENVGHATQYLSKVFLDLDSYFYMDVYLENIKVIILIVVFVIIEWLGRRGQYAIQSIPFPKILRWNLYAAIILVIIVFGSFEKHQFIYFQF